jgi:hypothetical protein
MADLHKAIRAIHDNVVTVNGNSKTDIIATDSSGNSVTINWTSVEAWTDPDAYKIKRLASYPNLQRHIVKKKLVEILQNGMLIRLLITK